MPLDANSALNTHDAIKKDLYEMGKNLVVFQNYFFLIEKAKTIRDRPDLAASR